MTTNTIHTEGLVLQAIPFKDYDRIISLLTPQMGVVKLFVKGKRRNAIAHNALITPLTVGEYLYLPRKNDLHRFSEGSIIRQHLGLREDFDRLESAEKMCRQLIFTQWPGKPSSQLYQLICQILAEMEHSSLPKELLALFMMKLLKHEGMLQTSNECVSCGQTKSPYRYGGERYCSAHAPKGAPQFSVTEETTLMNLARLRSLKEVSTLENTLIEKLERVVEPLGHY